MSKPEYDLKNEKKHVCCKCECPDGTHIVFWSCPVFLNESICGECCQIDSLRENAPERFSQQLGRKITREELDKICKGCGKNYAKENPALADALDQGTLEGGTNVDESKTKE